MSNSRQLANYGSSGNALSELDISDFNPPSYKLQSGNFTAVSSGWYSLDTSTSFTITLPASPSLGDTIKFALVAGDAEVNNLTVARNGQTIEGLTEDMTVASNSPRAFDMYFNGTTWRVFV